MIAVELKHTRMPPSSGNPNPWYSRLCRHSRSVLRGGLRTFLQCILDAGCTFSELRSRQARDRFHGCNAADPADSNSSAYRITEGSSAHTICCTASCECERKPEITRPGLHTLISLCVTSDVELLSRGCCWQVLEPWCASRTLSVVCLSLRQASYTCVKCAVEVP